MGCQYIKNDHSPNGKQKLIQLNCNTLLYTCVIVIYDISYHIRYLNGRVKLNVHTSREQYFTKITTTGVCLVMAIYSFPDYTRDDRKAKTREIAR